MQRFSTAVRVRYAPSPTGYLHLGGLRTALFNYLFAKINKGTFIVRIEDTDQTRKVPGSTEALLDALEWAKLNIDEGPRNEGNYGPYTQSLRLDKYQKAGQFLVENGHAYYCFCSSCRLNSLREGQLQRGEATMYDRACLKLDQRDVQERIQNGKPYTIRLKVPETPKHTTVKDMIRGYVQFNHEHIDDQVLLKSDGFPTYHLANVVDDHDMNISHVIRGEEWLTSTPKHVLLYQALGYRVPKFAHLGLLLNKDRSKLSKRQGDVAVEDFREKGYMAAGIVNFVALLGWKPSNGSTKEIFALKELEDSFAVEGINKSGSIVDRDRLNWINTQHIRQALDTNDTKSMIDYLVPKLQSKVNPAAFTASYSDEYFAQVLRVLQSKVTVLDDFIPLAIPFFQPPDLNAPASQELRNMCWDTTSEKVITSLLDHIESINSQDLTAETANTILKAIKSEHQLKSMKSVFMPIRYSLSGSPSGASVGDLIATLGKVQLVHRLRRALSSKNRIAEVQL